MSGSEYQIEKLRWNGEPGVLLEEMEVRPPDLIILLAAHFVAEHTPQDVDPLLNANVREPVVVMEAARLAGVKRFVMAGTFWEERSQDDPEPVDLYAATRSAAKILLRYYAKANNWVAVHLRVSDLYGPSDPRQKLFHLLRVAVLSGKPLRMSPGEQLIDLIHVDDAVEAFVAAAQRVVHRESPGFEEFGIFTDSLLSLRSVVELYQDTIHRAVPIEWGGRPYREREVMVPRVIAPIPGWRPRVPLADGLLDMERSPGGLLYT
jgi:nucleoside-diphosphate-sugar epimerase